jgi:glucokinase
MKKYTIGIDVGGTKIAYGLFDEALNLLDKRVTKTNQASKPEEMLDDMSSVCKALLKSNALTMEDVKGVGAGFPCHIDYENGYVITGSNLPTWKNVPVRQLFSERLGTRVEIDNDANVAALAEQKFGAGIGNKNMIYITVSTGIGGGIIINDGIFRGDYGAAGEIGHMIVSDFGYTCSCGNVGCLMASASGPKMIQYVLDQIKQGETSTIMDYVGEDEELSGKHIGIAASHGDKLAQKAIERLGDGIGIMFVNLYQIFNIKHYVLGGSVSKLGKPLYDRMNLKFAEFIRFAADYPIEIVPAKLGDDVGIVGAATLID